jgi:hypothetical protein
LEQSTSCSLRATNDVSCYVGVLFPFMRKFLRNSSSHPVFCNLNKPVRLVVFICDLTRNWEVVDICCTCNRPWYSIATIKSIDSVRWKWRPPSAILCKILITTTLSGASLLTSWSVIEYRSAHDNWPGPLSGPLLAHASKLTVYRCFVCWWTQCSSRQRVRTLDDFVRLTSVLYMIRLRDHTHLLQSYTSFDDRINIASLTLAFGMNVSNYMVR